MNGTRINAAIGSAIVATPGALAALEKTGQNSMDFLSRHVTGDWGELPKEDKDENQLGLEKGFRLLSSYTTLAGTTSMLNVLGKFIPPDERILLIEDTSEIHMCQDNLVRFEARQPLPSRFLDRIHFSGRRSVYQAQRSLLMFREFYLPMQPTLT